MNIFFLGGKLDLGRVVNVKLSDDKKDTLGYTRSLAVGTLVRLQ